MENRSSQKPLRILLYAAVTLILLLLLAVLFSPYGKHRGYSYKVIAHTIEIDAQKDSVFRFLGNSANASRWSVFVHHITPLNSDSFPDGAVGCRRRCFCNPDEQGRKWDELITERIPGKKRQLVIYRMVDFPMTAEGLATEQRYEALPGNRTRLTFTVFFKDKEPGLSESLKTYIAAYPIRSIFRKNMANIKRIVESEQHGQRL